MNTEKVKIADAIRMVKGEDTSNPVFQPTLYTREDVLNILENLDLEGNDFGESEQEDLKADIFSAIEKVFDNLKPHEIIDYSSAEFDLDYSNTVTLTSVPIDGDAINSEIESAIEDVFSNTFNQDK